MLLVLPCKLFWLLSLPLSSQDVVTILYISCQCCKNTSYDCFTTYSVLGNLNYAPTCLGSCKSHTRFTQQESPSFSSVHKMTLREQGQTRGRLHEGEVYTTGQVYRQLGSNFRFLPPLKHWLASCCHTQHTSMSVTDYSNWRIHWCVPAVAHLLPNHYRAQIHPSAPSAHASDCWCHFPSSSCTKDLNSLHRLSVDSQSPTSTPLVLPKGLPLALILLEQRSDHIPSSSQTTSHCL